MHTKNKYDELSTKLDKLEKAVNDLKESAGGMLSSADFKKLVIRDDIPINKEHFRKRQWGKLQPKSGFIIDPFNPLNLTPFSYDLTISNEVISCRKEHRGKYPLYEKEDVDNKEKTYKIEPGETVIIKTEEFIALPPYYSATVWPRFNFVGEGIFQSMVKIDPTWYGQLGVAITNLSPRIFPLYKGVTFSTLVIYQLKNSTDIYLFCPDESIESGIIDINISGVDINKKIGEIITEEKLKSIGLSKKCKIKDNVLQINVSLSEEEYKNLLKLDDSDIWLNYFLCNLIKTKTMNALGLRSLDPLLSAEFKGERIKRDNIKKITFSDETLEGIAIEHGTPFDKIAKLPNYLYDKIEKIAETKIIESITARIVPTVVIISFSIIAFLALITSLLGLISRFFQVEFPFKNIDIFGTLIVTIFFATIIIVVIIILTYIKKDPKNLKALESNISNIKALWEERYKELHEQIRILKESIKSR